MVGPEHHVEVPLETLACGELAIANNVAHGGYAIGASANDPELLAFIEGDWMARMMSPEDEMANRQQFHVCSGCCSLLTAADTPDDAIDVSAAWECVE